jgi:hypothetical protein
MEIIDNLKKKIMKLEEDLQTVQTELEIYKFKELEDDGYIYFNGIDNCEECKGWDGIDDRCQCGNQRVSWFYDDEWPQYPKAMSH